MAAARAHLVALARKLGTRMSSCAARDRRHRGSATGSVVARAARGQPAGAQLAGRFATRRPSMAHLFLLSPYMQGFGHFLHEYPQPSSCLPKRWSTAEIVGGWREPGVTGGNWGESGGTIGRQGRKGGVRTDPKVSEPSNHQKPLGAPTSISMEMVRKQ